MEIIDEALHIHNMMQIPEYVHTRVLAHMHSMCVYCTVQADTGALSAVNIVTVKCCTLTCCWC